MKAKFSYLFLACYVTGMAVLNSCKKEPEPIILPTVVTASVSEVTLHNAVVNGIVIADGGAEIITRGVCWNTDPNPTIKNSRTFEGTGVSAYTSIITGLTPNTNYHVRAYATNIEGVRYGKDLTFRTNPHPPRLVSPPKITTRDIFTISSYSASTGGIITDNGGGEIADCGVCWSTEQNPTVNNSHTSSEVVSDSFSNILSDLAPNTTYYVRAYATNSAGTTYGNQVTFTTRPAISDSKVPTIITTSVTEITLVSAVINSVITSDGGQEIFNKGICWATTPDPTTNNKTTSWGNGTETYPDIIYGLHPSTKYYVRAYAVNAVGTGYGDELSFTTSGVSPIVFNSDLNYGSVVDADGNLYKTIHIGAQIWMAENLRTTKFNDGASIPPMTDDLNWEKPATPGYSWYDNDALSFKDTYGALYNWVAVNTGQLCPTGWHVPTNAEWKILSDYLGVDAGNKMKEAGTASWVNSSPGANNLSGFTAIPGGVLDPFLEEWRYSSFGYLGYTSYWWSASEQSNLIAFAAWLNDADSNFGYGIAAAKVNGLSVRCLKD